MKYITKGYVRLAGTVLSPGKVFEAAEESEKISWLLSANAIERVIPEAPPVVLSLDNKSEDTGNGDDTADDATGDQTDDENAEDNDIELDEAFEDEMEAPEIDVMDGISADQEPETKTATSKGRGRKK